MNSTIKKRRGFTLVEMLVVITIIAILIGLLMPAINAARESARTTQCLNNQHELGTALVHYDLAKNRLPGVLSFVNPADSASKRINWVMSIFGELGRMDLWQQYSDGTAATSGAGVKVGQLICPSSNMAEPTGGLSYAVNLGVFDSSGKTVPDYSTRLFRNRAAWDSTSKQSEPDQSITSMKSPVRTVMLSEKLCAYKQSGDKISMMWTYTSWDSGASSYTSFTPGTYNWDTNQLAFQWPATGSTSKLNDLPTAGTPGPGLGSYHRGMIIVTFFDGHGEKIPETTACWNDPDNQLFGTP
jgi:prepilin-type N-terminal cleavage/methylation domain-containing protein